MPSVFNDLVKFSTSSTGTSNIAVGAAVSGYLTPALSGVTNGQNVTYALVDGGNRESGHGVYSSSGPTITRATVLASTNSGSKISLSGSATVALTVSGADLNAMNGGANPAFNKSYNANKNPPTSSLLSTQWLRGVTGGSFTNDDHGDGAIIQGVGAGLTAYMRSTATNLATTSYRVAAKVHALGMGSGLYDTSAAIVAGTSNSSYFTWSILRNWSGDHNSPRFYIGGYWSSSNHDVAYGDVSPNVIEWLALHFKGDGTVDFEVSLDGKNWVVYTNYALSSLSGTPTYIGIGAGGPNNAFMLCPFYYDGDNPPPTSW